MTEPDVNHLAPPVQATGDDKPAPMRRAKGPFGDPQKKRDRVVSPADLL